ncbi:hypothetical protein K2173_019818 [Erythroxylum novogranatense]|uniref:Uncharacterized protein n=1 Tax=Erythroxylum novogranatense TaxID=1862640 RepID=A0AAV8SN83_9ROSI|nr:hypothetical protein K2173_019818 [Erythroxylum novogranatense]
MAHGSNGPAEDDPMTKPTDPKKRPRFPQTTPTPSISAPRDLAGGTTLHPTVEPSLPKGSATADLIRRRNKVIDNVQGWEGSNRYAVAEKRPFNET